MASRIFFKPHANSLRPYEFLTYHIQPKRNLTIQLWLELLPRLFHLQLSSFFLRWGSLNLIETKIYLFLTWRPFWYYLDSLKSNCTEIWLFYKIIFEQKIGINVSLPTIQMRQDEDFQTNVSHLPIIQFWKVILWHNNNQNVSTVGLRPSHSQRAN